MPKARARKRSHSSQQHISQVRQGTPATPSTKAGTRGKKVTNPRMKAAENLFMPIMVALGCWGLAFSFIFLTSDANRYLYGGMAVIMAIMWSVMVGMRITRMRRTQQSVNQ